MRTSTPTSLPRRRAGSRHWLAALVLPIALVGAACAGPATELAAAPAGDDQEVSTDQAATDDQDTPTDQDATDDAVTGTPVPTGTVDTDHLDVDDSEGEVLKGHGGLDCSAGPEQVTLAPAPDLPEEVAALREFLIDAALRCDEQLLVTAVEESASFHAVVDDPTVDALGLWWELEAAGEAPFLRLAQVLSTTPGVVDTEDGPLYVWPRVATGAPEDTTPEAWAGLRWIDDPAVEAARGEGYLGWRAGISADGQWRYFLRGD